MIELKYTFASMDELTYHIEALTRMQWVPGLVPPGTPPLAVTSATVTPAKQEAARASARKGKTPAAENPATPLDALKEAVKDQENVDAMRAADEAETAKPTPKLTYEADVGPLIARAQVKDRTATIATLTAHGGVNPETGKPSGAALKPEVWPAVIAALDAILAG